MADHMSYMHQSFHPYKPKDNEHTPHLKHMHSTTTEDPHIRGRVESHSVTGGGPGTKYNSGTI